MYLYPDNLKSKATLGLWELRDVGFIGIGFLFSVFAMSQFASLIPLVFTSLFAFLTIRFSDMSIWDFLKYAISFFVFKNQSFKWRL